MMILDRMSNTRQDLLQLTDELLKTEQELEHIPYFTRKKTLDFLEKNLKGPLEKWTGILLEIRNLLLQMESLVQDKRYDKLDGMLKTLKFSYLVSLEGFRPIMDYYKDLCPSLERYLVKKNLLDSWKEIYGIRNQLVELVLRELDSIYHMLNVEEN